MPLPMVHLSVAVALFAKDGRFPPPDFLLGSISPDAIHMRPNTGTLDKERVHLMELGASPPALVQLFRTRYGMDGSHSMGFSAGYLTHLLTDFLWSRSVIDPFRQKLSPTLPEKEVRVLYYRDTDRIDFDLYYRMPWRPQVWTSLKTAKAVDFASLLTAEEITLWRDRTLLWFADPGHDSMVEPRYISSLDAQTFIDRAAREISELFSISM